MADRAVSICIQPLASASTTVRLPTLTATDNRQSFPAITTVTDAPTLRFFARRIASRIEITAFRRHVTIVSGKPTADAQTGESVCTNDADSQETITTESAEGQRILIEAVRLMEKKLTKQFTDVKPQ